MNPYEVLGVPPSATAEEIRTAYRRLTLAYHPDRNSSPGASDWMAQINRAYAILSDPAQRAAYDRQQQADGGRVRCTACTNGEVIRGHDGQKIRCPICLGRGTISREQDRREQARQEEAQRRPRHNWQQIRDEGRNTAQCARCGLIRTQNRARSGSSSAAPWDYYIEGRGGQWERAAYGLDRDCIPQPRPAQQTPPPRPTPSAEPAAAAPTPPTSAPARRKSRGWLAVTAFSLIVLLLGALAFGFITNWGENLATDSQTQNDAAPSDPGGEQSNVSPPAQSPSGASGNDGGGVVLSTPTRTPLQQCHADIYARAYASEVWYGEIRGTTNHARLTVVVQGEGCGTNHLLTPTWATVEQCHREMEARAYASELWYGEPQSTDFFNLQLTAVKQEVCGTE